ncbi:TetR/AcrR family transcriptional regulator [Yoonia sp. I 8.24]|uniref:TetR/AcrR family transcriptional regulator n=1 Tax=Yoonia sp. I 8.24 TaxID=1537229 RepID=UPI001EDF7E7E|nr:TetR family transcriptional regulator [Yoonia sp. I 8.24]MCG3269528.1 TetR family transcriptional regulator [Yoonia sp. I 8.24]
MAEQHARFEVENVIIMPEATERKRGRPQATQTTDLKLALLHAAIDLFAERGFDGVSLSHIAEKAGADKGLSRYYFGSKEALWNAAMAHLANCFARDLGKSLDVENASETDALKSLIRAFIAASALWPQVSRVIVHDGAKHSERSEFLQDRLITPFYNTLKVLITGAKSEGALPNVSDRTIFFMITHGGSFPMALPILTNAIEGGDIGSPDALEAHSDAVIELLFRRTSGN